SIPVKTSENDIDNGLAPNSLKVSILTSLSGTRIFNLSKSSGDSIALTLLVTCLKPSSHHARCFKSFSSRRSPTSSPIVPSKTSQASSLVSKIYGNEKISAEGFISDNGVEEIPISIDPTLDPSWISLPESPI